MRERRSLHDRAAALFEADGRDATRAGDGRRSLALAAHHLARGEDRARGIEALIAGGASRRRRCRRTATRSASTAKPGSWPRRCCASAAAAAKTTKRLALRAAVGISGAAVVYGDAGSERDEEAAIRGIQLAEELQDDEALASLLGNYGIVVLNSGRDRFAEGVELIERGVAVAKRAEPRRGHAQDEPRPGLGLPARRALRRGVPRGRRPWCSGSTRKATRSATATCTSARATSGFA